MNTKLLLNAFEQPVDESQQVFRDLLKAMSEPGYIASVHEMSLNDCSLFSSTWRIALTLLDHDTLVYLSPNLSADNVAKSIAFQTGARLTEHASEADFALITVDEMGLIESFRKGSIERPHESCTVLIQVPTLDSEHPFELSGPGIQNTKQMAFPKLSELDLQHLADNYQLYPCGLDFVFCTPSQFFALPRTTRLCKTSPSKLQGASTCM